MPPQPDEFGSSTSRHPRPPYVTHRAAAPTGEPGGFVDEPDDAALIGLGLGAESVRRQPLAPSTASSMIPESVPPQTPSEQARIVQRAKTEPMPAALSDCDAPGHERRSGPPAPEPRLNIDSQPQRRMARHGLTNESTRIAQSTWQGLMHPNGDQQ